MKKLVLLVLAILTCSCAVRRPVEVVPYHMCSKVIRSSLKSGCAVGCFKGLHQASIDSLYEWVKCSDDCEKQFKKALQKLD